MDKSIGHTGTLFDLSITFLISTCFFWVFHSLEQQGEKASAVATQAWCPVPHQGRPLKCQQGVLKKQRKDLRWFHPQKWCLVFVTSTSWVMCICICIYYTHAKLKLLYRGFRNPTHHPKHWSWMRFSWVVHGIIHLFLKEKPSIKGNLTRKLPCKAWIHHHRVAANPLRGWFRYI